MKKLLKLILGLGGLIAAWLTSRGATDPREWPSRFPQEVSALWDDMEEALAAGRRAGADRERQFDEEMGYTDHGGGQSSTR